jgi:hypothetical protein
MADRENNIYAVVFADIKYRDNFGRFYSFVDEKI